MWFPLDRFKAAWNTFFRRSILVHRRTKQTTNHFRRGTRAQFSMDTLRLTWLPFVFTCFLISSLGPIKTDAETWQFATLSARACAQCSPWNVPSPATRISKKHWNPLKVPVWVRYQIIQIHQFVELFAGWNEKNPTGVHLDWHGLYTNPSAKVPTRECCCINTFPDEVGLCDSENDVVIVIVFWKTNKRFGGSFFVFFHDISSTDVYIIFDCKIVQCFDFICTILCTYIYVKFWWQSTQHSKTSFHCSVFSDMVKIHQYHHWLRVFPGIPCWHLHVHADVWLFFCTC